MSCTPTRRLLPVLGVLVGCPKAPLAVHAGMTAADLIPSTLPSDPSWQAVVVAGGGASAMVLTCTDVLGPAGNECPVPGCEQDFCPETPALIVGMALVVEGPVSIPIRRGLVAWDRSEPGCDNVVATGTGEPSAWEPGRTLVGMPAGSAVEYVPEGMSVRSVLAVDIDGDGVDEWIVVGESEEGSVTGLVLGGTWLSLIEDVRVDVPADATDGERMDARARAFSGDLVGLTDLGLDGGLELVISGQSFETSGYEVGTLGAAGWTSLGKAGCAH